SRARSRAGRARARVRAAHALLAHGPRGPDADARLARAERPVRTAAAEAAMSPPTAHQAPELAPVREGEQQDWVKAAARLRARRPELPGPLEVLQFPGGHANLTYLLRFGARELVLRRPPFGPVAPGAHDMAREHKVLSRLWEQLSTAPRSYLFCE